MRKNKSIKIKKLVTKYIILLCVVITLLVLSYFFIFIPVLDSKISKEYEKTSSKFSKTLKDKDVSQISSDSLKKHYMQILTFDENGNYIKSKGTNLLLNQGEDFDYLPENKKILVYFDNLHPVKLKNADKNSKETSFVVYDIYQIAQESINRKYSISIDTFFGLSIFTIILLSFIFIRSIYRPVSKNFEILENSFLKYPNKFTLVDESVLNIEEARKLAEQYNSVVKGLEQQEIEKQKAIEAGNSLIINLAHDLKSPITILNGYADVLLNTDLNEDEKRKYLGYIYKSSEDLATLSNQLFDQIKYQNKQFKLNKEYTDICSVLRNSCANYYLIFSNNGFEFEVDIPERPIKCNIDKVAMNRVFNNLLQNIIDHNSSSCKVCVAARQVADNVVISVKNTGNKISLKDREKLFNPFYQVDNARSKRNSGMGLYIVKQIIGQHNGSIIVTDDNDYDVVFEIKLNCSKYE